MRNLFFILTLALTAISNFVSAEINRNINLSTEKVTQLIFPENIKKYRGGFDPELFIIDIYENVLYIQALTPLTKDTNLSIITHDNSYYIFTLKYNSDDINNNFAYVITEKENITKLSKEDTPPSLPNANIKKDNFDNIVDAKSFLTNNNGIRTKSMELFVKGIYIDNNHLYFKLEAINYSEIPFSYNYIGFYITPKKKGRKISKENDYLNPTATYIPTKELVKNEVVTLIYKFEKFTLSKERVLNIEMIENNGERNFSFSLNDKMILGAKRVK